MAEYAAKKKSEDQILQCANLERLRTKYKVTQQKLADEICNGSRTRYTRLEINILPDFEMFKKLADIFGLSMETLYDELHAPIELGKVCISREARELSFNRILGSCSYGVEISETEEITLRKADGSVLRENIPYDEFLKFVDDRKDKANEKAIETKATFWNQQIESWY